MGDFSDWLDEYRGLFAVSFMAIFISLIVAVTIRLMFFTDLASITAPVASVYGILVGAPFAAPVLNFVKDRLEKKVG